MSRNTGQINPAGFQSLKYMYYIHAVMIIKWFWFDLTWNWANLVFLCIILRAPRMEWLQIWLDHVYWSPSELIKFWSRSVDCLYFGAILALAKFQKSSHGRNDLTYGMIYSDHPQSWLVWAHALFIFPIYKCRVHNYYNSLLNPNKLLNLNYWTELSWAWLEGIVPIIAWWCLRLEI